jgi:hypothetical protein
LALALALGLLPAGPLPGAPAPPVRLVSAEVVLRVNDPAAVPRLAARLKSRAVLGELARWQTTRQLGCLKGVADPAEWLASRLEVSGNPKERSMTLRLVNCPRKDALTLLNEVVRVYEQRVSPESRLRHLNAEVDLLVRRQQAVMQLQLAQVQVAGAVQGNVMVPVQVWGHVTTPVASAAAGPSLVLKPPRLIYNSR